MKVIAKEIGTKTSSVHFSLPCFSVFFVVCRVHYYLTLSRSLAWLHFDSHTHLLTQMHLCVCVCVFHFTFIEHELALPTIDYTRTRTCTCIALILMAHVMMLRWLQLRHIETSYVYSMNCLNVNYFDRYTSTVGTSSMYCHKWIETASSIFHEKKKQNVIVSIFLNTNNSLVLANTSVHDKQHTHTHT